MHSISRGQLHSNKEQNTLLQNLETDYGQGLAGKVASTRAVINIQKDADDEACMFFASSPWLLASSPGLQSCVWKS